MNNLTEQKIREIAREESLRVQSENFKSGSPKVPPHKHDNVDNLKISQSDIIPGLRTSGNITFAQQTQYKIGVNFNPTSVLFYGLVNNGSSPTFRAHCIGSAFLGRSYYLQPLTTTSVSVGGQLEGGPGNIVQSSSYFSVDNSGVVHALSDEGHIVDVEFGGTIYARMTVFSFSNKELIVNVDNLASGYQIIGNFIIT